MRRSVPETVAAILMAVLATAAVAWVAKDGSLTARRQRDVVAGLTGGDADRGALLIEQAGCGGCHVIPGVDRARGRVGPDLTGFARRAFIAGVAPNTPASLVRWIQDPRAVSPHTAMPALGLDEAAARDIAGWLYLHTD